MSILHFLEYSDFPSDDQGKHSGPVPPTFSLIFSINVSIVKTLDLVPFEIVLVSFRFWKENIVQMLQCWCNAGLCIVATYPWVWSGSTSWLTVFVDYIILK